MLRWRGYDIAGQSPVAPMAATSQGDITLIRATVLSINGENNMSEENQNIDSAFLQEIKKKNSGLNNTMGVIVLLMGLLAMGSPFIAGLSIAIVVGILFIIGGLGQLAFAFQASR